MQRQPAHPLSQPAAPRQQADDGAQSSLPGRLPLKLRINGHDYHIAVEPRRSLLDALRHDCGLTGAKKVCDMGNCGACTIVLDGKAVYGCLVLAAECEGREITTIEGLGGDAMLDRLQQCFIEHDAFQCGYCTPGQILSLKALLDANPNPGDDEIAEAVAGNLCRCGAYRHIFQAARAAVEAGKKEQQAKG